MVSAGMRRRRKPGCYQPVIGVTNITLIISLCADPDATRQVTGRQAAVLSRLPGADQVARATAPKPNGRRNLRAEASGRSVKPIILKFEGWTRKRAAVRAEMAAA